MNWDGASGTSSAGYFKNRLQEATVNGASGWLLTRPAENRFVAFDSNGLVQWIRDANGQGVSLTYTAGKLTAVTDDWGRSLQIIHGPNGVSGFADPAGQQVSFAHATINQQASVTYQDGTTKTYVWDEPDWATGSPRLNRLTGIIDESGQRYASFGYLNGKAASTQHAGNADRFSITDARSSGVGNIVLTSPLGSTYTTTYSVVNGISRPTSSNQPAGSGCAAASSSTTYDGNGNRASVDDFNGKRACYVHALNRNLETTRVEGLPTGSSCSTATAANATLPTGSRKTTTEWHPDWHFKARVAEPGRITTNVYNGQPDPFNANSVASCAPVDALLPDGKPIAVLCKKVEQATTDADGSKGFGAVLHNGVSARQWTYTYNRYGQLLTAKGPRTDVNDTTTFSYYTDTTADHTMGDLQSVTDAAGNVTSYPLYNKHGQALRVVDSNGVATDYTYDLRQRLTSVSVGGQTTSHEYYPTGLLKRVTQPDGSYVHHSYDDAHRLVAINDNAGNRIDYTLDNAGNRTGEQVRDPAGALARQLSRSIDALGRVQQATGRE
jgi:YD repeat-containing protein